MASGRISPTGDALLGRPLIIAVDGPAAAGKGTLARRLAAELALPYLDTGLLYRAVARRVLDEAGDPADAAVSGRAARALTGADLARGDLRTPEVDVAASQVAAEPEVRAALLGFQRRFGAAGGVLDGRDIGTVIFPDAPVKLFVTATTEARARRRWRELRERDPEISYESVLADLRARDQRDAMRAIAPLRPAPDALVLDTTAAEADAAFARAIALVRERVCPGGGVTDPILAKLRRALDEMYGARIERVVLFGSRARGDAEPDSDYDIAVFLHDLTDRSGEVRRLAELQDRMMADSDPYIDAIPFPAGGWAERTTFMHELRREGLDL